MKTYWYEITGVRFMPMAAITLWPFIFYRDKEPSYYLRVHEHCHLWQIKRETAVLFYFRYIKYYLKYRFSGFSHNEAYLAIPYEVEAFQSDKNSMSYYRRRLGHDQ